MAYKRRARSKKSHSVRGGAFGVPTGRPTTREFGITKNTSKHVPMDTLIQKGIKLNALKSANPAGSAAKDLLSTVGYSAAVRIGEYIVDVAKDSLLNDGRNIPTTESNSITTTKKSNVLSGVCHKTKFHVGRPTSRSIINAGKQNGSRKFNYSDTMTDIQDAVGRSTLSIIPGFNRKGIISFDAKSYWSYADLFTFFPFTTYVRPTTKSQRSYLLTKYFGTKTKVMNQNKYTNVKIKVNWVRQLLTGQTPVAQMSDCFNGVLPVITSPENNMIPYNLQMEAKEASGTRLYCSIDPVDGSLSKAPNYRESFDVVNTMTKTLKPGDIWEIDYCHYTGPGLILEDMWDKYTDRADDQGFNENAAAFYYPVFEMVGPQVEAFESTDTFGLQSYIGTAPCAVHFEFSKYGEIVENSRNIETAPNTTVNEGGMKANRWAIKTYTAPGPLFATDTVARRFSLGIGDILKTGEAAAASKFIIPVTTDYNVDRGGRPNLS